MKHCAILLLIALLPAPGLSGEQNVNDDAAEETKKEQVLDAAQAEALVAQLASAKREVHTAAADRLAEAGEQALPALLKQARSKNETLRARVTAVLGRIDSPQALDGIYPQLRDKSPEVCCEAIRAVGNQRKPESIDRLRPFLLNKDPLFRLETVMALGRIGDSLALPEVKRAAADDDPNVRKAAVAALGLIGDTSAIGTLIDSLGDEHKTVRAIAYAALKTISGTDFTFKPDDDEATREEAVQLWKTWWETQKKGDTGGNAGKETEK